MEDSKKSGRDTLWKILVCVALLVFLVSGGLTLRSYLADKRAQKSMTPCKGSSPDDPGDHYNRRNRKTGTGDRT